VLLLRARDCQHLHTQACGDARTQACRAHLNVSDSCMAHPFVYTSLMPARKHLRRNKTRTHASRVAFEFFIQFIYASSSAEPCRLQFQLMPARKHLRRNKTRTHASRVAFEFFIRFIYASSSAEPCRLQFQLMHLPQFVMSMLA
jgi:hypothetical protein